MECLCCASMCQRSWVVNSSTWEASIPRACNGALFSALRGTPFGRGDRQSCPTVRSGGYHLVIVSSGVRSLHRLWADEPAQPRTAVLGDLCGRLHRSFGVRMSKSSVWCHTFIIDGEGILRLRLTHHFVERDLDTLRQMTASKVPVAPHGYPSASTAEDVSTKSFMGI